MKELLIFIVSHLVDHPESISVNEIRKSDKEITLELTVDPSASRSRPGSSSNL